MLLSPARVAAAHNHVPPAVLAHQSVSTDHTTSNRSENSKALAILYALERQLVRVYARRRGDHGRDAASASHEEISRPVMCQNKGSSGGRDAEWRTCMSTTMSDNVYRYTEANMARGSAPVPVLHYRSYCTSQLTK